MFGIGETELVIIVVFAFLLFGPDKLPGMGRTLGRMLRQFREASDGFTEVVQTNIMDPAADELKKSPKQRRREEEEAMSANTMEGDAVEAAPEVAPRRETFAERKARLAAERRAREDAGTLEPQTFEDDEVAPGVDSDEDVEDATPRRVSAKDLYAMSPTKAPDTESVTADVAETDATDEGAAKTEGRDGGDRI